MLVRVHALLTDSAWAQQLLASWQECSRFLRVVAPRQSSKPAWKGQPPSMLPLPDMVPPTFPQA